MAYENSKIIREYVHNNSDELSDLWDYDAPQQDEFHYALYEVELDLEVDMDTGKSRIVKVYENGYTLVPDKEL